MKPTLPLIALVLASAALAQQSTSYELTEHTLNAGGDPADGIFLTSTSYRITLDAIGDSAVGPALSSTSYSMEGGFIPPYPPPGEVAPECREGGPCVLFADPQTLTWPPERSAGSYNLYRDLMSNLLGLGYGLCEQQEIDNPTTTVDDSHELSPGDGYFYLVTAENRLDEEGTKGWYDGSVERLGTACP